MSSASLSELARAIHPYVSNLVQTIEFSPLKEKTQKVFQLLIQECHPRPIRESHFDEIPEQFPVVSPDTFNRIHEILGSDPSFDRPLNIFRKHFYIQPVLARNYFIQWNDLVRIRLENQMVSDCVAGITSDCSPETALDWLSERRNWGRLELNKEKAIDFLKQALCMKETQIADECVNWLRETRMVPLELRRDRVPRVQTVHIDPDSAKVIEKLPFDRWEFQMTSENIKGDLEWICSLTAPKLELSFHRSSFTEPDIQAMVHLLKTSDRIQAIQIECCQISLDGVLAIVEAVTQRKSLQKIILRSESVDDKKAPSPLPIPTSVQEASQNLALAIALMIQECKSLTEVAVENMGILPEEGKRLIEVAVNSSIQRQVFQFNSI